MSSDATTAGMGVVGFVLLVAVLCVPGAFCWDYSVSQILGHMGKPDTFDMWWHGFPLAVIPGAGQICFPLAAIMFVLSFVL